jgi:hypothetical protein
MIQYPSEASRSCTYAIDMLTTVNYSSEVAFEKHGLTQSNCSHTVGKEASLMICDLVF